MKCSSSAPSFNIIFYCLSLPDYFMCCIIFVYSTRVQLFFLYTFIGCLQHLNGLKLKHFMFFVFEHTKILHQSKKKVVVHTPHFNDTEIE